MNAEEQFLAAICEAPDDDAPRLMYADWLTEHGDPRGEFIRLQCRLAQMSESDPLRFPLEERERELLAVHERAWRGSLARDRFPRFTRGFLETVHIPAYHFLAEADTICRTVPVRNLILNDVREFWKPLARCPHLERVASLTIREPFAETESLHRLLESDHLRQLRGLDLSRVRLDLNAMWALTNSRLLSQLERLELDETGLTAHDMRTLAGTPRVSRLRALSLNRNDLAPEGMAALSTSPYLKDLRVLRMNATKLGAEGAVALAGGGLQRLRDLSLEGNNLTEEGARVLAEAEALSVLQQLRLSINKIGNAGVAALADSEPLSGLTLLSLAVNRIDCEGAQRLAYSPSLGRLVVLNLMSNPIRRDGAWAFVQPNGLPDLKCLRLPSLAAVDREIQGALLARYGQGLRLGWDEEEETPYP